MPPVSPLQAFDGVEVCSGTGILSRVLRDGGYKVCNMDIVDWASYFEFHQPKTSGNPLDLLTPAGMSLLDGDQILKVLWFGHPSTYSASCWPQKQKSFYNTVWEKMGKYYLYSWDGHTNHSFVFVSALTPHILQLPVCRAFISWGSQWRFYWSQDLDWWRTSG